MPDSPHWKIFLFSGPVPAQDAVMRVDELISLAEKLEKAEEPIRAPAANMSLGALEKGIRIAEAAWSGSWLGYHARVYHEEMEPPPAGTSFRTEWGLITGEGVDQPSTGKWNKYRREDVVRFIWEKARNPKIDSLRDASARASRLHAEAKTSIDPLLASLQAKPGKDAILDSLVGKVSESVVHTEGDFLKKWSPRKTPPTKDEIALAEGLLVPPHLLVKAEIWAIRHPFMACGELAKTLRWLAGHITELEKKDEESRRTTELRARSAPKPGGPGIALGHGKSGLWRLLRDRMAADFPVPCHGFQQVPLPGLGTMAAMLEVLPRARFAILMLTREDVACEGEPAASLNVARLAGLFQGRLGFSKVLLLTEEGGPALPGVNDLPRLVFPAGDPVAIWPEARAILESELPPPAETPVA